ncbi:hypothetical protein Mal48_28490 [Thalassoglobus polymorphus]|uniref:Uncharacterized protein n=1 Tax=Thalassoglobus polymorphus TaxID=2527994 RepID=A0A517QPN2_9PLAN|nr:hypothetical protein Mal48_28490 [Thalassoglobus polymorphus]
MDAWKIPQSSHSRLDRNFLMDALPCTREERISLVKMQFATRPVLQTNSKDALVFERVLFGLFVGRSDCFDCTIFHRRFFALFRYE